MHADSLRAQTVAAIVAHHPATARVFQAHHIDFCCHGDVTVAEALRGRAERPEAVLAEVASALRAPAADADPPVTGLSVAALVARIIDRHHAYLRRALPSVSRLVQKIAEVHGAREPALLELVRVFAGLSDHLLPHLDEEEAVLFPLLMSRQADRGRVVAELDRMRAEHLEVGQALCRVRELVEDFEPPAWACTTYRLALAELEDLETDVLRHVHLENHVLAPRWLAQA
jgi:regulator of cell morphogenesis and NO signaling